MPRSLCLILLAGVLPLQAAIWPEQLWDLKRTGVKQVTVKDQAVWEEYGLDAAEQATYGEGVKQFTATAYRLKDPTSAMAVMQWLNLPATRIGNYVLLFEGYKLTKQQQDILQIQLPRLDQASLPVLPDYLPKANLVPGSTRYVIGPAGLAAFEPRIPPSVAAFSMGAEGQLATYKTPAGDMNLAIFSYPTPQMARDRSAEFQKIPGAVVKRTGSFVVATIAPPNADEAEKLLAKVNYQANITWNEKVATKVEGNMGDLILGAVKLIGLLVGFTLVAGLGYAGFRIAMRKWGGGSDEEMVTLHLEQ